MRPKITGIRDRSGDVSQQVGNAGILVLVIGKAAPQLLATFVYRTLREDHPGKMKNMHLNIMPELSLVGKP